MMRSFFTSFMPVSLAPAYAFAGSAPRFSPAGPVAGDPVDGFSMVDKRPLFSARAPELTHASLFARIPDNPDDTVAVPPRLEKDIDTVDADYDPLSDIMDLCFDAGMVKAVDVHTAMLGMRMFKAIRFEDAVLASLFLKREWIMKFAKRERNAMKSISATLESREAELDLVNESLKNMELNLAKQQRRQRGPMLQRLKAAATSLLHRINPAKGKGESHPAAEQKRQTLELASLVGDMKEKRDKLEADIAGIKVAKEWLSYTVNSELGFICFTHKGCKVAAALDRMKGDPRMNEMSIDDYLKII
ncbi:MAG: hypothetical protein WC683_16670 [bacterium]